MPSRIQRLDTVAVVLLSALWVGQTMAVRWAHFNTPGKWSFVSCPTLNHCCWSATGGWHHHKYLIDISSSTRYGWPATSSVVGHTGQHKRGFESYEWLMRTDTGRRIRSYNLLLSCPHHHIIIHLACDEPIALVAWIRVFSRWYKYSMPVNH